MDAGISLQAYAEKWHVAWPEQDVLNVFVSAPERELCSAWGALLFELHDSLFCLEHDTVRQAKCLWWSQELLAMSANSARHPLTRMLQSQDAPFAGLAEPLAALAVQVPVKATQTSALFLALQPLALAVSACEASLFGSRSAQSDAQSIIGQWLVMRLPHGLTAFDRAMLPMHLLARHQAMANTETMPGLRRDWLQELRGVLLKQRPENWYRHAQWRFTLRRIAVLNHRDTPLITPGHAWDAWRAVRSGRNA